jgi:hypothetical protein
MVIDTSASTPWRTVHEAAARAHVSPWLIYREVRAGRLRAARIGGARSGLRLLDKWIDEWLDASAAPVTVTPARRFGGRR